MAHSNYRVSSAGFIVQLYRSLVYKNDCYSPIASWYGHISRQTFNFTLHRHTFHRRRGSHSIHSCHVLAAQWELMKSFSVPLSFWDLTNDFWIFSLFSLSLSLSIYLAELFPTFLFFFQMWDFLFFSSSCHCACVLSFHHSFFTQRFSDFSLSHCLYLLNHPIFGRLAMTFASQIWLIAAPWHCLHALTKALMDTRAPQRTWIFLGKYFSSGRLWGKFKFINCTKTRYFYENLVWTFTKGCLSLSVLPVLKFLSPLYPEK